MQGLVAAYMQRLEEWHNLSDHSSDTVSAFTTRDVDEHTIKWNRSLQNQFGRGDQIDFSPRFMVQSMYRPFVKQWLYYDPRLIEMMYRNARGCTGMLPPPLCLLSSTDALWLPVKVTVVLYLNHR